MNFSVLIHCRYDEVLHYVFKNATSLSIHCIVCQANLNVDIKIGSHFLCNFLIKSPRVTAYFISFIEKSFCCE